MILLMIIKIITEYNEKSQRNISRKRTSTSYYSEFSWNCFDIYAIRSTSINISIQSLFPFVLSDTVVWWLWQPPKHKHIALVLQTETAHLFGVLEITNDSSESEHNIHKLFTSFAFVTIFTVYSYTICNFVYVGLVRLARDTIKA